MLLSSHRLVLFLILLSSLDVIAEPASSFDHDIDDHIEKNAELHIHGTLSPTGLDRLGKPVSIMTHKELRERSESTIGEILANEPGVSSSYFGPGASRPVVRGQTKQRVRMLENGLESGDLSDISEDHAVSTDPTSVQRIDVLRGSSTLLYGSSAIGGAVNMIDNSIAETPTGSPFTGEIDLRKGDNADKESTGAFNLNGQSGKFNWHISSFLRDTDDIKIPGSAESAALRAQEVATGAAEEEDHERERSSRLENTDARSHGFKLGASHVWDQGFFGLALKLFKSKYGIPGHHAHGSSEDEHGEDLGHDEEHNDDHDHELHEEHGEEGANIDLSQIRLESRGEFRAQDDFFHTVRVGSSYSHYEHNELDGDVIATAFDKDSFDSRVEFLHGHGDGFQGNWGAQLRFDDLSARGDEAFIPSSETFTPALFIVEDHKINNRLVWQLGGRYEYARVSADEQTAKQYHMVSASTGPVVNLDNNGNYTAGMSIAYSERAPTATELFARGAHLATQSYEIGTTSLTEERSVGAELFFKKNLGKLTGQTNLFVQHYFDYINLTATGDEKDGLPVYLYGLDRARFWGIESEVDYELFFSFPHAVHCYGQVDYVRADNLSDNDPLPRITPLRTKLGVRYEHNNLSGYLESMFVSTQDRTADFELPTDRYTMLNAGVGYQLPAAESSSTELYLRATNLLDDEARAHTSFIKDIAPLRGRAFFAGIKITF